MKKKIKKLISVGDRFIQKAFGDKYILARLQNNEVKLISLANGNRFTDGKIIVSDVHDISSDEWVNITSNCPESFTRCR
jgi:hypothetical protein